MSPPALVLADVMMPRLDGFGLLRAIRDDPTLASTPVILVSARAGEESRVEGLQAGADDYLVKPFTARELLARVETHLKLANLRRESAEREVRIRSEAELEHQKLRATEERLAETSRLYRELQNREAKIRRLVDANIVGVVIWDLDGRILDANNAFLRMVGYEREDVLSGRLRWRDLTPRGMARARRAPLDSAAQGDRQRGALREGILPQGRQPRACVAGSRNLRGRRQSGCRVRAGAEERKRAADALRELQMELAHANRLATMGQLAASIAHEVNQPIGAARNNAHAALRFLADDLPDLAEVREALECVVSETYRAGDIIGRIRDQVKKAPPRTEDVDLNNAIEEVVALVRGELSKNRVSLHTQLAEGLSPVRGDRVQLQQVMLNLILNATEAMSGGDDEARELVLHTDASTPDGLIVAIGDSGPGIPPEDRERIFESFYTTKAGGVGIGLSICRSIIEAHGGRLWADEHQPRGAVLKFTLPMHH